MELTQYENADFIYIVRFKKLTGESTQYKEVCSRLLQQMRLWMNDFILDYYKIDLIA
jgi:hypothetical protein